MQLNKGDWELGSWVQDLRERKERAALSVTEKGGTRLRAGQTLHYGLLQTVATVYLRQVTTLSKIPLVV